MDPASLAQIKKELMRMEHEELLEACLRLARFKKDNKELLTYFLFLSKDEAGYASYLCGFIDDQFDETPNAHKKTLRKIIRWMNKCIRFSGVKETEYQVRMHFCRSLRESRTPFRKHRVMWNMYVGQIKKIRTAISKFHDDIKRDLEKEIVALETFE
ncbi:MAG: hypothetical protein AB8B55_16025 [Mariniblastus sp.]